MSLHKSTALVVTCVTEHPVDCSCCNHCMRHALKSLWVEAVLRLRLRYHMFLLYLVFVTSCSTMTRASWRFVLWNWAKWWSRFLRLHYQPRGSRQYVTPCSPVDIYRRFGESYCLCFQDRRVRLEGRNLNFCDHKSTIFSDVTPCSPVDAYRRFGENYCLCFQDWRVRLEGRNLNFCDHNSTIFSDVTPCSPVDAYRRFGENYCLCFQGRRVRLEGRNLNFCDHKSTIFSDVTPCSQVDIYRRFGETYCPYFQNWKIC
jgi:hypothetical protein